jgi:hypothetical protein
LSLLFPRSTALATSPSLVGVSGDGLLIHYAMYGDGPQLSMAWRHVGRNHLARRNNPVDCYLTKTRSEIVKISHKSMMKERIERPNCSKTHCTWLQYKHQKTSPVGLTFYGMQITALMFVWALALPLALSAVVFRVILFHSKLVI